jgi:hypothetical protein
MKKMPTKWVAVLAALIGAVLGPKAQEIILQVLANIN